MISINTNLASLIIQQNLKNSSLGLNQAIERMTTGYKINYAKDNAANYSINTNLSSRLNSYQIAQDNASMGLDMATTAMDSLNLLSDHLSRLRALAEQAANGTYGANSLQAIQSEAIARIQECKRTIRGTEYNQINLFGEQNFANEESEESLEAEIAAVRQSEWLKFSNRSHSIIPEGTERVSEVSDFESGKTYVINDSSDILALQTLSNAGKSTTDVNFILSGDIDMKNINFTGIKDFYGTFDGNGYAIKNLKMGFMHNLGFFLNGQMTIKNLGIEDCDIRAYNISGVLLASGSCTVENCYFTGTLRGGTLGGIVGNGTGSDITIKNCYSALTVMGNENTGGLVGFTNTTNINIENCCVVGEVTNASARWTGGLVGRCHAATVDVKNSCVLGSVSGLSYVGGLIGQGDMAIDNCYFLGNVTGTVIGGLVGEGCGSIKNSYAKGHIKGGHHAGGLIGYGTEGITIENSYYEGSIEGTERLGGLVGSVDRGVYSIKNSHADGVVIGTSNVGGIVGFIDRSALDHSAFLIENCYANNNVIATGNCVGGIIGYSTRTITIKNSYSTQMVQGVSEVGGLIGQNTAQNNITSSYSLGDVVATGGNAGGIIGNSGQNIQITQTYSYGSVSGTGDVGGLVGVANSTANISNSVYNNDNSLAMIGRRVGVLTESNTATLSGSEMQKSSVMEEYGFTQDNGWFYDTGSTPLLYGLYESYNIRIPNLTDFQVGIHSGASSKIRLGFEFSIDLKLDFSTSDKARESLGKIDEYLSVINQKQTEIGAGINRLESALEEISSQILNLSSTRSTIRDADIAKESSAYIKSQILQQAASTLLATANQTPSIALGLLQNATIRH